MNSLTRIIAALIAVSAVHGFANAEEAAPTVVPSKFEKTYVPQGFDSNDQAQFAIEGQLPDTCYRSTRPEVKVDHDNKTITVNAKALYYQGPCLQMVVAYHQIIEVGLLKTGTYAIMQGTEKKGELNVKLATHVTPDDYLYAPVQQAYLKRQSGRTMLRLNLEFFTDCQKMVDVQVSTNDNVVVVQPITVMERRPDCAVGFFPLEKTVEVKQVKNGRYLLHVRSLNTQAINTIVDLK